MNGKHHRKAPRRERIPLRLAIPMAATVALIAGGGIAAAAVSSAGPSLAAPGSPQASDGVQTVAFHGGPPLPRGPQGPLSRLTASPDCTLRVPANPLTAAGLATPYVLSSAGAQCSEGTEGTAAFVQAVILAPGGGLSVYDPEVINAGGAAPVMPPVPHIARGSVVAIWTGFNGNVLKLTGPGHEQFVNFAQQAYDNSPALFAVLNADVHSGRVIVPAAGTGTDGMTCPTSRDFSLVDQDQSDNVPVFYQAFGTDNGSDEALLNHVQAALGCPEWKVPLLDPSVAQGGAATTPAGLLQELQAAYAQAPPVALVPGNDEFTTNNGQFVPPNGNGVPDLFLQNLYRLQTGQPLTGNSHDTGAYCRNLAGTGEPRLKADASIESAAPAPDFAQIGTNLANVLAARFAATWSLLNCQGLTGQPSPITVTTDGNGVAVSATYA